MNYRYDEFISELIELLRNTIDDFIKAYEVKSSEPLFSISNKQFQLMNTIDYFSKYQVLNGCKRLCENLCNDMKLKTTTVESKDDIDFVIYMYNRKLGVLVSNNQNFMPDVSDEIINSIDYLYVVVLEEFNEIPQFYPPNSIKYKKYKYKDKIKQITIKQFFGVLGRDDYNDFKECVARYMYEAEQMLGMTVSTLPTKKALNKHRENIVTDLLSYFYKEELLTIFNEEEIFEMKQYFEKYYEVLICDSDFAKSFISSEWYYKLQVLTDEGLEQTAVVAGYLKSLEQLLVSILLVLSNNTGKVFEFERNNEGRKLLGNGKLPLTHDNQKLILTMAGNLIKKIKGRKDVVLRRTSMTDRVLEYLDKYVDKTRNGYLHKDNIYEWNDIQIIRKKTFAMYFMILGTFNIDADKLMNIS